MSDSGVRVLGRRILAEQVHKTRWAVGVGVPTLAAATQSAVRPKRHRNIGIFELILGVGIVVVWLLS
jgi:hypothetical protein